MWLLSYIDEDFKAKKYGELLSYLFDYEYTWYNELDENWAGHAMALRERFYDESIAGRRYAYIYGDYDEPCSVLEMLVSLSIKAEENIMADDDYGDRTCVWFWTMLGNLDLLEHVDGRFNEAVLDEKIERFLNKEYNSDGTCGPFKLSNSVKFKICELPFWQQAMIYLSKIAEN